MSGHKPSETAFELRARIAACRSYLGAVRDALEAPEAEIDVTEYLDRLDAHLADMDHLLRFLTRGRAVAPGRRVRLRRM